jgi:hypothetical protein
MRPGVRPWKKRHYDYVPGRHLGLKFAGINPEEVG